MEDACERYGIAFARAAYDAADAKETAELRDHTADCDRCAGLAALVRAQEGAMRAAAELPPAIGAGEIARRSARHMFRRGVALAGIVVAQIASLTAAVIAWRRGTSSGGSEAFLNGMVLLCCVVGVTAALASRNGRIALAHAMARGADLIALRRLQLHETIRAMRALGIVLPVAATGLLALLWQHEALELGDYVVHLVAMLLASVSAEIYCLVSLPRLEREIAELS